MEEFKLAGSEYIELKNLLKVTDLVESGGEAKSAIDAGEVQVDGVVETRKGRKIRDGMIVLFQDKQIKVTT